MIQLAMTPYERELPQIAATPPFYSFVLGRVPFPNGGHLIDEYTSEVAARPEVDTILMQVAGPFLISLDPYETSDVALNEVSPYVIDCAVVLMGMYPELRDYIKGAFAPIGSEKHTIIGHEDAFADVLPDRLAKNVYAVLKEIEEDTLEAEAEKILFKRSDEIGREPYLNFILRNLKGHFRSPNNRLVEIDPEDVVCGKLQKLDHIYSSNLISDELQKENEFFLIRDYVTILALLYPSQIELMEEYFTDENSAIPREFSNEIFGILKNEVFIENCHKTEIVDKAHESLAENIILAIKLVNKLKIQKHDRAKATN